MLYFGTNTKQGLDRVSHRSISTRACELSTQYQGVQFFILPTAPLVLEIKSIVGKNRVWVGSQSVSAMNQGNTTGEISASTLKEIQSDLVMVGHAERRALDEDEITIARKLIELDAEKLRVLLCIGERDRNESKNQREEVFQNQLKPIKNIERSEILIAYEPVWAIGSQGISADADYVGQSLEIIKKILSDLGRIDVSVLYGGSVNSKNALSYSQLDTCDGLFVGRSAWSADGFEEVFKTSYSG
jgi:triosephosphate isomerase